MTQLKGSEVERFLARPSPERPVVLLFGPDSGAVHERADELATVLSGGDPLSVSRFDESELASESGRLASEAYAASLFSARRIIRIRAGGPRSISAELKSILDDPPSDTWIIIEAGDLRKTAPLRRLCEGARAAAAIGCYPDNDAALGRLIDREIGAASLSIDADARVALVSLLGADRAASKAEIEKLCLYARDAGTIHLADIAEMVGDGAAFAIDDVVDAAATGDVDAVERGLRRLFAAGTAASSIGVAVERRFLQLHRLRSEIEAGGSIGSVIQAMRPPLFAARKAAMELQLRVWSVATLGEALRQIDDTMAETRLRPAIAGEVLGRTLLSLAARARRSARSAA